ncbi:MAG: TraI domain-containing protein [Pseudomonadota bacterium]|nr:TraI domain-containing protein [Pseudomonadota bacterium]
MATFLSDLTDKLRRKKITTPDYNAQSLFKVLRASQLFTGSDRRGYLKRINDLVKLPEAHFHTLYADLIDNFVEYAQILPIRYNEHLSGIMQEGLRHGLMALQLLFETSTRKPEPLFVYAVFSMALLADVVKVISTQKVMISDENGAYIDEWCPFTGSMLNQGGEYFKVREYRGYRQAFLNSANPLIAQRVMPDVGLRWLASDSRIFDMWIAVLTGHEDWAGELGHLLKLLKKQQEEAKDFDFWIDGIPMESTEPTGTDLGEKFMEWLKDALENEKISVNEKDSFVHILDEGIYLETPSVYAAFNHTYSNYRDFIVLQEQFNNLGITKLSGYDFRFEQYFAQRSDTASRLGFLNKQESAGQSNEATRVHQGMIIKDTGFLYTGKTAIPQKSQYMKGTSVNWALNNALPQVQIAQNIKNNPANQRK